jgi:ABC-type transport system involved in cytochrome bd biosynthesis fused ATPase/permease subunit
MLMPAAVQRQGKTVAHSTLRAMDSPSTWGGLQWSSSKGGNTEDEVVLQPGTLVAVVGPSGSGKTTFLDRFCGLLGEEECCWLIHSQQGDFRLSGSAGARQLRQRLAYAPQEAVLFEASLRHNLLLDQQLPNELIHSWMERVGLSYLLQRPGGLDDPLPLALDHYSGGEIHRLGLLRAWMRNRPVEVLDEPTAFLDAESAERVRRILLERSRERLVLVSTHDPDLMNQADRIVQLEANNREVAEMQHHGS